MSTETEAIKVAEEDLPDAKVPAEAKNGKREPEANKLFRMVMKLQASDLHLKVGQPPMVRLRGDIRRTEAKPVTQEDMERMMLPLLSPRQRKILDEEGGVDLSYVIGNDECRFRVSLFRQKNRLSLVSRRVNNSIPSFAGLGLPPTIEKLCNYPEGMIIFAGVTGSGKSTSIAAMLDYVNAREPLHILTVEDPIEFVFTDKKSYINQREIGLDVCDWHKALKDAVRQDPDVMLIGELRERRNVRGGHPRRRNGPPGIRHDSRRQRRDDDQPYPRPVPAHQAPGGPPGAGEQPQGGDRAEAHQEHQAGRRAMSDQRDHALQSDRA